MFMKFQHQHDQMDCGPACLAMITSFFGKHYSLQTLRDKCFISREGVSLLGISQAAKDIGLMNMAIELKPEQLDNNMLPCILYWNQKHFVVLKNIRSNPWNKKKKFKIADPGHGFISLSEEKLKQSWLSGAEKGIALLFQPGEEFYYKNPEEPTELGISYVLKYLKPHRKKILWIFLMLFLGTLTTLALPILTKMLIDEGVSKKDIGIIGYILAAQMAFFVGNLIFGIIRNWITLIMGTKINIEIISDFLRKLFNLPIKFFDTKMRGDFNQRIQDHERIETFLTSQSLTTIFSVITFSVFFIVLLFYNFQILFLFIILTMVSILWSLYWMRKRKILDYLKFDIKSQNQDSIYEMIDGIGEMKLNQFEDYKRENWEDIQKKLFKINMRTLKLEQIQYSGFEFINQGKNILVTFFSAIFVIHGGLTLGELLSISYIIGMMNSPVYQLISFFRSFQDARLSLSRLNEVQNHHEEDDISQNKVLNDGSINNKIINSGIQLKKISFQYEGPNSPWALQDIDLSIPHGKITAIVGASGSGKTTLLKLLLKFYEPTRGTLLYDSKDILTLSSKNLRQNIGTVMQEGYIFSDSIERNIIAGDKVCDKTKLMNAIQTANISEYIENLPLGFETKIGSSGTQMSGGQKQRLLIARAVYKNPRYIFFDEATSALDAENEKIIHGNLNNFFKGKTVLIIAHRLSTVKNADQIVVMKSGRIVEIGCHRELIDKKGEYFELIKNQLELSS